MIQTTKGKTVNEYSWDNGLSHLAIIIKIPATSFLILK